MFVKTKRDLLGFVLLDIVLDENGIRGEVTLINLILNGRGNGGYTFRDLNGKWDVFSLGVLGVSCNHLRRRYDCQPTSNVECVFFVFLL